MGLWGRFKTSSGLQMYISELAAFKLFPLLQGFKTIRNNTGPPSCSLNDEEATSSKDCRCCVLDFTFVANSRKREIESERDTERERESAFGGRYSRKDGGKKSEKKDISETESSHRLSRLFCSVTITDIPPLPSDTPRRFFCLY